jgi:coenzyme PQQ precursor peptide PqqA
MAALHSCRGWTYAGATPIPTRFHNEHEEDLASIRRQGEDVTMAWTTPTLVEICIGLEINGYLPAEI